MVHPWVIDFYGKLATARSLESEAAKKIAQFAYKEEEVDDDGLEYMYG